jgi:hypothetical protein
MQIMISCLSYCHLLSYIRMSMVTSPSKPHNTFFSLSLSLSLYIYIYICAGQIIAMCSFDAGHSVINLITEKQRTQRFKKTNEKKTRRQSGKPKTDLFENRPSVGFRFIENRLVSVSVSVSHRALSRTSNYKLHL